MQQAKLADGPKTKGLIMAFTLAEADDAIVSPQPAVATKGAEVIYMKEVVDNETTQVADVDTALKALEDEAGEQVYPDGNDTAEAVFVATWEKRPQMLDLCHRIYFRAFAGVVAGLL